jgi:hypothetical protein
MDAAQRQLVMETLRRPDPPSNKLLALERLGDEAFDLIVALFRSDELKPIQRVYALRRLARLTRQECYGRTEELFRLTLSVLDDPDRVLRSGATRAAIVLTWLLERNPRPIRSEELKPGSKPSLREQVQARVRVALELGLDDEDAELARKFLANER